MIIAKIEGNPRYLENKNKFKSYLIENPYLKSISCNKQLTCLSFIFNFFEIYSYLILFIIQDFLIMCWTIYLFNNNGVSLWCLFIIWGIQESLLSIITPRNFVSWTSGIIVPLICRV